MRALFRAGCAALLLLGAAGAVAAQERRTLELGSNAPFNHRHSGLKLPPALQGVARGRVIESESDQLDLLADYPAPDLATDYTIYIFRNVSGSVPVWFDRAQWMIEHRGDMGTATLQRAEPFVPPGQSAAAGLIATYALAGGEFKSTGVALFPLGEWYVKLRASSKSLGPAQLAERMQAALAELGWPRKVPPAPAASLVAPCSEALDPSAAEARPVTSKTAGAEALMGALMALAPSMEAKKPKAPSRPVLWCRDPATLENAAVYRPDAGKDAYLLTLGDAGRGAWVGRSVAQQVLEQEGSRESGPPSFTVTLLLLSRTLASGAYDRLPPPRQTLQIVDTGKFATSVTTWGKGGTVEIGTDALK